MYVVYTKVVCTGTTRTHTVTFVFLYSCSRSRILALQVCTTVVAVYTSYCFDSVAPNALPAANIFVVAVLVCLSKYMM